MKMQKEYNLHLILNNKQTEKRLRVMLIKMLQMMLLNKKLLQRLETEQVMQFGGTVRPEIDWINLTVYPIYEE